MTGAERRRRRRLIAMGERQDAEEFGRLFEEQMQAMQRQLDEFEGRNGSPSSALPATLHVVDEVDRYPAAAPERRPLTASDVQRMRDELEMPERISAAAMRHVTFTVDHGPDGTRHVLRAQIDPAVLGLGDPRHDPRAQAVLAYVEQHVREQVERLTREAFDPWRGTAQHTERMRTDPSYRAFMDPLLAAQERGELLTGPNDPPTRAHVPQQLVERAARTDEELRDALQRRYRALYGEQGRSQADRQAPEWAKPLQPGQRVPRGET